MIGAKPVRNIRAGILGSAAWLVAQPALSAGFYFPEVGTPSSLGTGGVANPTNIYGADAAWTNPAGMTALAEDRIFTGLQVVLPEIEFDSSAVSGGSDGGNAGETAVIPSLFYLKKLNDRASLGFSITAPLGGGVDYGDDFAGRYETINAFLEGIALSPSLGYEVTERLSLGVGVSFIYTLYEQDIAINPALVPTVDGNDGKIKIENADDWGYQPFFGLTYRVADRALLGVVYRSEMDVDLEGDVSFRNLGDLTPQISSIDVSWDNPQTLEAGLSFQLSDTNTLFLNAGWQDWSAFSDNDLSFTGAGLVTLDRNWDDTWHAGVGFAHLKNRQGYSVGFSYESSPVDNDDRTFDLPVDELYRFSASYSWSGKRGFDYSLGGSLTVFGDTEIDNTVQGVRVSGDFDNNYLVFLGGTLRYVFGANRSN